VAIILGVNDVLNPAALQKARRSTACVNKRSMAAGHAGLDNECFYMDKTMMVFGDAKKVVEDMGKAIE
jgi:NAD(P) transhydrogenase subunit beta